MKSLSSTWNWVDPRLEKRSLKEFMNTGISCDKEKIDVLDQPLTNPYIDGT